MIVYGLTGSIGMGKSTAAGMLKQLHVPVHDSDAEVHSLLRSGEAAFEEVAVTFPEAWDSKKFIIKRDVLGDIVFKDERKRKSLEEILHPHVRQAQKKFIMKHQRLGRKKVVLDIPLLFETQAQDRVDYTILVTASFRTQCRRVMQRHGMTEDKFFNILQAQLPDSAKRCLADHIVPTDMGLAHTYKLLKRIMDSV